MSVDNPRTHWHAERPDADQPSKAELADPRAINHPWCRTCHCRHGHNDPWCAA